MAYKEWMFEKLFVLVPAQDYVGQFLSTFREYPQPQRRRRQISGAELARRKRGLRVRGSRISVQAEEDRPNVVLIVMGNLGWGEIGCYGGGILRGAPTPRLDSLASEGTLPNARLSSTWCWFARDHCQLKT